MKNVWERVPTPLHPCIKCNQGRNEGGNGDTIPWTPNNYGDAE